MLDASKFAQIAEFHTISHNRVMSEATFYGKMERMKN